MQIEFSFSFRSGVKNKLMVLLSGKLPSFYYENQTKTFEYGITIFKWKSELFDDNLSWLKENVYCCKRFLKATPSIMAVVLIIHFPLNTFNMDMSPLFWHLPRKVGLNNGCHSKKGQVCKKLSKNQARRLQKQKLYHISFNKIINMFSKKI